MGWKKEIIGSGKLETPKGKAEQERLERFVGQIRTNLIEEKTDFIVVAAKRVEDISVCAAQSCLSDTMLAQTVLRAIAELLTDDAQLLLMFTAIMHKCMRDKMGE